MRKLTPTPILIFTLCLAFALTGLAHAQEPAQPALKTLEIDLWPEYDRPAVLVIYRIVLAAQVELPAELTFRIPVAVGDPNAVAARQMDGSLINIPYDRQPGGEYALVIFSASTPELQLEYYAPDLGIDGNRRSFTYTWPGDYAVESASVQAQQPLGASNLSFSPNMGSGVTGSDGLSYYTLEIGALKAGQSFNLAMSYDKTTEGLTIEDLQLQPSAPIPNTSEGLHLAQLFPWFIGVLGTALIVGGVWWFIRSGRQTVAPRRRKRSRAVQAQPAAEAESPIAAGAVYCHQCGKRASPGDVFCRSCGTRLRLD
jgi:hypothetical protein